MQTGCALKTICPPPPHPLWWGDRKKMKGLNPSKAFGPDELHSRVFKEPAIELGPVLALLFQQSLDTGEISKESEWYLANICPLYKKGNRTLPCNYHPVSSQPGWLSWMRHPNGDQEVAGSTPAEVSNILSWRSIMKYFLRSFSPFL